jgi:hypothetical protein
VSTVPSTYFFRPPHPGIPSPTVARRPLHAPAGGPRAPLYYCPTRLAASLCSGFDASAASASANADIAGGHVIVETNYRVGGVGWVGGVSTPLRESPFHTAFKLEDM